ncbi:MAG: hypothetical protein EOM44_02120 [Bacteroidia bacterium]|nr:hypothetical protein [Bacteroidia bacterium]
MTATNDSMTVSREMKVLFLQIMKEGNLTKSDAEALVKIFVENGLIRSPTEIVFKNFDNEA